ncbi:MAG: glycosyltransferase family 4 protein [Candidatus Hodarchaeales archaeon]
MLSRVLIIVDNFPPAYGGVARSAQRLVRNLLGHYSRLKITVLTINPVIIDKTVKEFNLNRLNMIISQEKRNERLTVIAVPRLPKEKDLLHEMQYRGERILREFQPDLIIGFFIYRAGFIATYLGQRFRVPVLLSARGNDLEISPFTTQRFSMVKYALKHCQGLTTVTNDLANIARALNPGIEKRTTVTYNGINLQNITFQIREKKLPKRIIIGFIGDDRRKKGLLFLFEAMNNLALLNPEQNWSLVIAGRVRKPMKTFLKEAPKPVNLKVKILGELRADEMDEVYNQINIQVIPSLWDGFPNCLLEGVSRGIPIVLSDTSAMLEFFPTNCVNYFTSGDPLSLAAIISVVKNDYYASLKKASKAYIFLQEKYTAKVEFKRWKFAIDQIIMK